MTLLKTYLVAVARVCEFGLFGGYLEASIISQLNLDELEKDPPQLRFSEKVCNTESANNWDYSYYLPHYGYPFNHKNTGHGNHHSPKTSYNSKYHTGPLLSYITPYRFVGKPPLKARKPFGCEAVQLNMVFRHAERNPSWRTGPAFAAYDWPGFLEKVINPLMRKSTGIHPSVDIQFPWKNPYLRSEALEQVPEGDKQMHNIGLRFAKRFPELLQGRFSIADLKFTSTCKRRCSQSVTAFALGYLTGKGHVTKHKFQPIPLTTFPCDSDLLLRPWDVCPKYVKTVLLNKTTAFEAGKFLKAKFGKTIEKVREKLGLVGRKEVNARLVMYMMSTCFWAIQTDPNYPEGAGWCSLFNEQDINIFEYYGDLYLYYSQGPANPLSIGCFLLKDIFTSIQIMAGKMKGGQKHKVVVQVGHANTEVYLLMVLGVFTGDEKLTADNYEVMKNREFKLGIMSPMSGNVVLVLHKCFYGEFMIQLYVNERLMKLPPCKSKIGCSLREFEVYYKPKIERCKYENLCKI